VIQYGARHVTIARIDLDNSNYRAAKNNSQKKAAAAKAVRRCNFGTLLPDLKTGPLKPWPVKEGWYEHGGNRDTWAMVMSLGANKVGVGGDSRRGGQRGGGGRRSRSEGCACVLRAMPARPRDQWARENLLRTLGAWLGSRQMRDEVSPAMACSRQHLALGREFNTCTATAARAPCIPSQPSRPPSHPVCPGQTITDWAKCIASKVGGVFEM
jgi:hypothetical protein